VRARLRSPARGATLAVLGLLAVQPRLVAQGVYHGCGMAGNAAGARGQALNRLKNRYTAPEPAVMDTGATLAALLSPGDDRGRWSDQRGAAVVGYVRDVKPGGFETSNCLAKAREFRDTHIELIVDPANLAALPVIVEVTPRWRAMMAAQGVDWSTATLRRQILGRWVRVTGWLMFDAEHADAATNTAPGHPHDWRATAWEVHPITELLVVPRPR
jgi:hypothetical protein